MSTIDIQKYKTILVEAHIADGGKISKTEAQYTDRSAYRDERCKDCVNFMEPDRCRIVEGMIDPQGWCKYFKQKKIEEKWGTETSVSPSEKGKYAGKTKAELLKSYNSLKQSGPHKRGSAEFGRMRELAFAIRAKGGWGKVE